MPPDLVAVLMKVFGLAVIATVMLLWLIWNDRPPGPPAH